MQTSATIAAASSNSQQHQDELRGTYCKVCTGTYVLLYVGLPTQSGRRKGVTKQGQQLLSARVLRSMFFVGVRYLTLRSIVKVKLRTLPYGVY